MSTILLNLDHSTLDHKMLHEMHLRPYLHGSCYAFALGLTQGLSWPMVGLMKDEVIWHAGVRSPDGRIHDIRGFLTDEEFGAPYLNPPFTIREITTEELFSKGDIPAFQIKKARKLAEVLWPELPWIESYKANVKAFADELEALSRKYGLWIYGGVPADLARLYIGGGEEGGYKVCPTVDGLAHTITRYFTIEEQAKDLTTWLES